MNSPRKFGHEKCWLDRGRYDAPRHSVGVYPEAMGAGVPGGAYIAFSALLAQMGVPAEALACIIGVDAVMDIFIKKFARIPLALLTRTT